MWTLQSIWKYGANNQIIKSIMGATKDKFGMIWELKISNVN